jgi:glucokinase
LDGVSGILYTSPNLPGWEDVPLARIFSDTLSLPVIVENDVNCAAYAEYIKGAGKGTKHFVCITLGTGVGGGILLDGKLHRGSSGFAGEIGHMVLQIDGPPCSCGSRGCLETLVGAGAIVERTVRLLDNGAGSSLRDLDSLSVERISQAAFGGDALAARALEETGYFLGVGLANIVHIFDPEAVAIGGGVSRAGEFLLGPARIVFRRHVMDNIFTRVRITQAGLGNAASFLGAAFLALDEIT